MKKQVPVGVVIVETVLLLLFCLRGCYNYMLHYRLEECLREDSPDGGYTLVIWERGYPDWPFGSDHLEVGFFSKDDYGSFRTRFQADVANDGAPAWYQVEWIDTGVRVTLSGEEQPDAVYVLPYPQPDGGLTPLVGEEMQEEAETDGTD